MLAEKCWRSDESPRCRNRCNSSTQLMQAIDLLQKLDDGLSMEQQGVLVSWFVEDALAASAYIALHENSMLRQVWLVHLLQPKTQEWLLYLYLCVLVQAIVVYMYPIATTTCCLHQPHHQNQQHHPGQFPSPDRCAGNHSTLLLWSAPAVHYDQPLLPVYQISLV